MSRTAFQQRLLAILWAGGEDLLQPFACLTEGEYDEDYCIRLQRVHRSLEFGYYWIS